MVTTDPDIDDVMLSSDSDNEVTDKKAKKKQHKKLLKDIDALSGVSKKRSRKTKRNEPSREISEFSWSTGQGDKNKLDLNDLVGSLETKTKKLASTKKKLRNIGNSSKTLKKPLHKPEQQKIERIVAYEETAKDVSKWNPTVQKNREAEHLSFPLNVYKPPPTSTKTLFTTFQPKNDLEREIDAVLRGSQHLLERKNKELTQAEEDALKKFDLQEALERRKELQKIRALQSYYESKCRRMKKIKSKKYHRILKKEQQKSLEKVDLEKLSKENPELYQTELDKAEKLRALERANLRHRNTSKWAKNLITKGVKNKEDHERIREQLRISRQLTDHKAHTGSEDEGENDDNEEEGGDDMRQLNLLTAKVDEPTNNPWLLGSKKETENSEINGSGGGGKKLKKPSAVVTTESKQFNSKFQEKDTDDDEALSSGNEWEAAEKENDTQSKVKVKTKKVPAKKQIKKKKKKKKQQKKSDDVATLEKLTKIVRSKNSMNVEENLESDQEREVIRKEKDENENQMVQRTEEQREPTTKNRNKKTPNNNKLKKQQPDGLRFLRKDNNAVELNMVDESSDGEHDDNDDTEQRMNIREAFANDDVIDDFIQEKKEIVKNSTRKPADLTMPGWGGWAGAGIDKSKKRKRKNQNKEPIPAPKRKDDGKAHVIISEERNKKLAMHQVSEVPFPFKKKAQFEKSIRQPIGIHWNTQSVYQKLTMPRIERNSGSIIAPIQASKSMKKNFKKDSIKATAK